MIKSLKLIIFIVVGVILIVTGLIILYFCIFKNEKLDFSTGSTVKVCVGGGVFCLMGAGVIIAGIIDKGTGDILDREGIFTSGEIIDTKKDDGVIYAHIRYMDSDGNEQIMEDCFFSGVHRPGDKVDMRYAKRKNGKYVAQALDRG